jgi:hypothetical protein
VGRAACVGFGLKERKEREGREVGLGWIERLREREVLRAGFET